MSTLHKKCFLASAGMHLSLFLVILIGPAFLTSRDRMEDMLRSSQLVERTEEEER